MLTEFDLVYKNRNRRAEIPECTLCNGRSSTAPCPPTFIFPPPLPWIGWFRKSLVIWLGVLGFLSILTNLLPRAGRQATVGSLWRAEKPSATPGTTSGLLWAPLGSSGLTGLPGVLWKWRFWFRWSRVGPETSLPQVMLMLLVQRPSVASQLCRISHWYRMPCLALL